MKVSFQFQNLGETFYTFFVLYQQQKTNVNTIISATIRQIQIQKISPRNIVQNRKEMYFLHF